MTTIPCPQCGALVSVRFPLHEHLSKIGREGGKKSSKRKTEAARRNAKLPRKKSK